MQIEKKVAIIEVDYHPEVLRNTLMIFNELPVICEVFTTKSIWDLVDLQKELPRVNLHLLQNHTSIQKFFRKNLELINSCNFVFFYTLETRYKIFTSLKITTPVVLLVHNSNSFFKPWQSLYPRLNYFYIRKDIPYILLHVLYKFDLYYRQRFLKSRVNFFCFPSEQIVKHVTNNNYIPKQTILPTFRLAYTKFSKYNFPDTNTITISIIGQIDCRRRDYMLVYNAFKHLLPQLNTPIELKLLGRPIGNYGKRVIKRFKQLENSFFKVTSFTSFIGQEVFESHIKQTHFLIVPVYKTGRHKLFQELYGYTKISGNINDMIMYCKPAVIPTTYPLPNELKKVVKRFNGVNELAKVLQQWISTKQYLEFNFDEIEQIYNLENTAQNTNKIVEIVTSR